MPVQEGENFCARGGGKFQTCVAVFQSLLVLFGRKCGHFQELAVSAPVLHRFSVHKQRYSIHSDSSLQPSRGVPSCLGRQTWLLAPALQKCSFLKLIAKSLMLMFYTFQMHQIFLTDFSATAFNFFFLVFLQYHNFVNVSAPSQKGMMKHFTKCVVLASGLQFSSFFPPVLSPNSTSSALSLIIPSAFPKYVSSKYVICFFYAMF